jgi:FAD/FMN-containing dehydrogenase
MGVDNIISLRVVLASGDIITTSSTSHPDLFWAMRGAGLNFGIVISMTVNAMPSASNDSLAYISILFFSPDKIERVAQAIQDLPLTKEQKVFFYLANPGPPSNEPCILVNCFLHKGTEETGRADSHPFTPRSR